MTPVQERFSGTSAKFLKRVCFWIAVNSHFVKLPVFDGSDFGKGEMNWRLTFFVAWSTKLLGFRLYPNESGLKAGPTSAIWSTIDSMAAAYHAFGNYGIVFVGHGTRGPPTKATPLESLTNLPCLFFHA